MTVLILIVGATGLVICGICLVGMCWEFCKPTDITDEIDR